MSDALQRIRDILNNVSTAAPLTEDTMTDGLPASTAKEVLTGPGVKEADAVTGKKATHPQDDPKAKNTSTKASISQTHEGKDEDEDDVEDDKEDKKPAKKGNPFAKKSDDEGDEDEGEDKKKSKFPFFAKKKKTMEEESAEESVHLNALFDGEEISEEFKEKTATIFEAAVAERVEEVRSEFSEAFEEALAENVEAVRGELVEHLDGYLNYVVEKFMEENKIEIDAGLGNEIAESFMAGLRNLFVEHNIDVPEDKIDMVDDMSNRVAELEAELDEHINQNMEMATILESYRRNELIAEAGDGLADTQFEKFASLCENISYTSDEDYAKKLQIIKENYISGTKPTAKKAVKSPETLTEENTETNTDTTDSNPEMQAYVATLGRFGKNQ